MGGYGSGNRGSRYYTAERSRRLTVRQLMRAGLTEQLEECESDYTRVTLSVGAYGASSRTLTLTATRPNYGGLRWWFRCPRCSRRAAVLYWPPNRRGYQCRVCADVRYQCQRETRESRLIRKAHRVYARIEPIWPQKGRRPKGMHRTRYWRLSAKADSILCGAWVGRPVPTRHSEWCKRAIAGIEATLAHRRERRCLADRAKTAAQG